MKMDKVGIYNSIVFLTVKYNTKCFQDNKTMLSAV